MPGAVIPLNFIDEDSTIVVSSEDSNYPKENIFDFQAPNLFKSESKTALSIDITLSAEQEAKAIALINHNLTSSATVSLYNGDESPAELITTMIYRQYDMWRPFNAISATRFVLQISDSNSENLQFGQIVLGTRWTLPRARRIADGYRPSIKREAIEGETYGGAVRNYFLYDKIGQNPRFRLASESELATFRNLDLYVYGNAFPFVYIPDWSAGDVYYVRKEKEFNPTEIGTIEGGNIAYDYEMELVEETRGIEVLA